MNNETFFDIIKKENLMNLNFFEEQNLKSDQIVISKRNNKYVVFVTDERASCITGSEEYYTEEELALNDVLERLRANKILNS